jgi:TrmH family RNA methyltransferase
MLSKNLSRFIISLQKKKTRDGEGLFVIEGDKIVREFLMAGIALRILVAKREFISSLTPLMKQLIAETHDASFDELRHAGTLKTPHNALAVLKMPERGSDEEALDNGLCAALDFVQDPGNLGTIIRAAAWFGIRNIVCSADSVDMYNPKVIQATMGAILHVRVFYSGLKGFLDRAGEKGLPIYGTVLGGESVYEHTLGRRGIILLGNESRGISGELMPYITDKIMIPGAGRVMPGIESLNVGMAASVVFSEFQRQNGTLTNYKTK